jgi:hypothetical protein
MTVKAWSTTLPRTRRAPFSGSNVVLTNVSMLDSSNDDDFITTYDGSLWTETLNNSTGFTGSAGNPIVYTLAPTGTQASVQLAGDVAIAQPVSASMGWEVRDAGIPLNGEHQLFTVNVTTGGPDTLDVEVVRNDATGTRQMVVTWNDNGGNSGTETVGYGPDRGNLRLVFANGWASVWDDKAQTVLWTSEYSVAGPLIFTLRSVAPAGANGWDLVFKPFKLFPTVTGLWDRRGSKTPYVTQATAGEVRVSWKPGYPGTHTPVVYGTGSNQGSFETSADSIEAEEFTLGENHINLMASNVEELYDDFGGVLVCRDMAIANPNNKKDIIVPMQCFDDGSPQNGDSVSLITRKPGDLSRARSRFSVVDEQANDWGESFRFDRILQPDANLLLSQESGNDRQYELIRCLYMSNGDRAYYGLTGDHDQFSGNFVYVHFIDNPGTGNWELVKKEADANVETQVASAAFSLGDATISMTEPGFYIFRGTGGEEFNAHIRFGEDNTTPIAESSVTDGEVGATFGVAEIHFTYKMDKAAYPFVLYHDVSADTVTLNELTTSNASNRNGSVSAFETSDGDVVLVWQDLPDVLGWLEQANRVLTWSKYDVSGDTWAAEKTVALPDGVPTGVSYPVGAETYSIRAFDLVKTDDSFNLIFSAQCRVEKVRTNRLNGTEFLQTVSRAPVMAEGYFVASWSPDVFDFENAESAVLDEVDLTHVECESYRTLFEFRSPDYSGAQWAVARAEIDYIKAEYDPDLDLICLTLVDYFHRLPMVFAGRDRAWNEVAVGLTRDVAQFILEDGDGRPFTKFDWFGIETAHAVFGYDGMVYLAVSRPESLGVNSSFVVIDPSLFWENRNYHIERGPDFAVTVDATTDSFDIFYPKYRQEEIPLMSVYRTEDGPRTVSMQRANQHLVVGMGGFSSTPVVMQSVEYDQYPMSTTEEDVWLPEYGDQGLAYWGDSGSGAGFTDYYMSMVEVESPAVPPSFGKTLSTSNTREISLYEQSTAGEIGYKFHCRQIVGIGTPITNLTTMPSKEHYLTARCVASDGANGHGCRARFKIGDATNPNDLVCQVWDDGSSSWVTVHTFEDYITSPEIVDYFILIKVDDKQGSVSPSARVIFAYKRRQKNIYAAAGPEYFESYQSEGDWVSVEAGTEVVTTETSSWTMSGTTFPTLGSTSNNSVRLYQMGWNMLNIEDAYVFNDPKGGWTGDVYNGSYSGTNFVGSSWRSFNDGFLMNNTQTPAYQFLPSSNHIDGGHTPLMHWYNGFRYQLSGFSSAIDDSWTLSREVILHTSWLASKRLHGWWYTQFDTSDVYIWADALDSQMDKFYANAFMVLGANMRRVVLVGKDDLLDPWTELATLDMKVYDINDATYGTAVGTKVEATVPASLLVGTGRKPNELYWEEDGKRHAKVLKCADDKVYLDAPATHASGDVVVFAKKGVKVLEDAVRYRYIGIKVPQADTYEGRFEMHTFDFGYVSDVPLKYHASSGSSVQLKIEGVTKMVFDENSVTRRRRTAVNEYKLEYKILDRLTYQKILAAIDKISYNRRPIWLLERNDDNPSHMIDLCLITDPPKHELIVDEDGEEYYTLTFGARSVK